MLKEQFKAVLAEFGELVKLPFVLDEDDVVTFTVDEEIIVNLQYLDASDTVLVFAPVGALLEDDPRAGKKALALLKMSELGQPAAGYTLALDEEAELVLAMDRRSALELASADSLAAWLQGLLCAVKTIRERMADEFPEDEREGN